MCAIFSVDISNIVYVIYEKLYIVYNIIIIIVNTEFSCLMRIKSEI